VSVLWLHLQCTHHTLEVADTLRQPPAAAAAASMKKSLLLGLGTCLLLFGVCELWLPLQSSLECAVFCGFTRVLSMQGST
jgi:hypothetical protein